MEDDLTFVPWACPRCLNEGMALPETYVMCVCGWVTLSEPVIPPFVLKPGHSLTRAEKRDRIAATLAFLHHAGSDAIFEIDAVERAFGVTFT